MFYRCCALQKSSESAFELVLMQDSESALKLVVRGGVEEEERRRAEGGERERERERDRSQSTLPLSKGTYYCPILHATKR